MDKITINNMQNISSAKIKILQKTEEYSRTLMSMDDLHGIGHVERVMIIAKNLLKKEKCNSFIVYMAVWLHDIGRVKKKIEINDINKSKRAKKNHAVISAEMSELFFQQLNFPDEEKKKIIDCIISHSFSSCNIPTTIEAKIVSDADKIDALGSVGIYRASCYQHDHGTGIEGVIKHFHEKLLILDTKILTETGKILAKKRINYMNDYLDQLNSELR